MTALLTVLLLVAMLMVNLVLMLFWQQDALQREAGRDRAVLDLAVAQLAAGSIRLSGPIVSLADFQRLRNHGNDQEKDRIVYVAGGQVPDGSNRDRLTSLVAGALTEAIHNGKQIVRYTSPLLLVNNGAEPYLVSALPVVRRGSVAGAVAMIRSLEPLAREMWRIEKMVLGYILINLVVLVVIGFFRMRQLVVRPIERLVSLADRYSDQDTILFTAGSPEGEFGQLARSLNAMLTRIEQDRHSLEKTVAELEAANRRLKQQQQEMIRTEKLASVGRLAAGLAHEIGNPLGIVQGYLGLLDQAPLQDEESRDFVRRADRELQRVNTLIRQLLDFARVSEGNPEPASLHEVLFKVIEMMRVQAIFRDMQIRCDFAASRDLVYADQDRLRQVFVNCLLNSADAIIAAGRRDDGVIAVSTDLPAPETGDAKAGCIRIRISDNGTGITMEEQANIFDPFYTTKEPGKGTGLGLSVSLSIIESMGGRMEMDSDAGQGSELSIFLPLFSS